MSPSERTCVLCGKLFTLLPNKPGLVNNCPTCSTPYSQLTEIVERKPRTKRTKTLNEEIRDIRVRRNARQKINDVIFGKPETKDN